MSRPTVNCLGPHSWWEAEPIGCPTSEDSRIHSYYCRCQLLHSQPVLCCHTPARGHHSGAICRTKTFETQHGGLPAMCQERFLSLLVFACERPCDCSKQLDRETWITLQATELTYCHLAKHGTKIDPQQIHGTFWRVVCGEPDLTFSFSISLQMRS